MNKRELKLLKKYLKTVPLLTSEERLSFLRILQSKFLPEVIIELDKKAISEDIREQIDNMKVYNKKEK